jgi:apolipoprotein N-acyltransferase
MEKTLARFVRSPFGLAAASGLLLWAAFPPLGWWPLAWLAPVGWLWLIRRPETSRRFYLGVWLAGWGHWLLVLQGIRLAHPLLYLGWLSLSAYLAVYLPLFVALARIAVHRSRTPLCVAAPIVWTGLELVRGYALTGFSMALLGHTQVRWTRLIQIADLTGAYGVSFLVMLGAACLTQTFVNVGGRATFRQRLRAAWPAAVGVTVIGAVLVYGAIALREQSDPSSASVRELRVALIQGSVDTIFEYNPERDARNFHRYRQLCLEAVRREPRLDLIVWPESMFTGTLGEVLIEGTPTPPPDVPVDPEEYAAQARECAEEFRKKAAAVARLCRRPDGAGGTLQGAHLLVGTDTQQVGPGTAPRYNAALLIAPTGAVTGRYYKIHRVIFGEYMPFGDMFPWLYRITPLAQGLTPGDGPRVFEVAGVKVSPSICFESTVPHLIRRQVTTLARSGARPDLLVNVTNDGWFWGSSILDLHLTCNVFRAVELRLPLVVAANTGFSAHIDRNGHIVQQGPRRAEQVILARVRLDGRVSWYNRMGDVLAGTCLAVCIGWAAAGVGRKLWPRGRAKRAE